MLPIDATSAQSSAASAIPSVLNPRVAETINELQSHHHFINFPGDNLPGSLTAFDYQQFLLLLNERFKSFGSGKVLEKLLMPCSPYALYGLFDYLQTKAALPFKHLALDFKAIWIDDSQYAETIKTVLLRLSEQQLSKLSIEDPEGILTEERANALVHFIQSNPVTIDINLPARLQASPVQRNIDEAVSNNKLKIKENAAKEEHPDKLETIQPHRDIRKRSKANAKQSLSIDVELQQEQQVEIAVESTPSIETTVAHENDYGIEVYGLPQFQTALQTGSFSESLTPYLINQCKLDELWCTWLGFLNKNDALQKESLKLSKAACEELLRFKDQFQYGLDLNNLPPGFMIKSTGTQQFIHFSNYRKTIAEYQPLSIQTLKKQEPLPLAHNQLMGWLQTLDENHPAKLLWNKIDQARYDKKAHRVFKQYLPQMLSLKPEQQTELSDICFKNGRFNSEGFKLLLDHSETIQSLLPWYRIKAIIDPLFKDKTLEGYFKNKTPTLFFSSQSLQTYFNAQKLVSVLSNKAQNKIKNEFQPAPPLSIDYFLSMVEFSSLKLHPEFMAYLEDKSWNDFDEQITGYHYRNVQLRVLIKDKTLLNLIEEDEQTFITEELRNLLLDNACRDILEQIPLSRLLALDSPMQFSDTQTFQQLFKENTGQVEQFISDFHSATPDAEQHLLYQLLSQDNIDPQIIAALGEKVPGLNLDGILQLYIQAGKQGLDALINFINEDINFFNAMNTTLLSRQTSYMPVLSKDFQDAVQAIKGLSGNERVWWDNLLTQHADAQQEVYLPDLVEAFITFKEELRHFTCNNNQHLSFPAECHLKGVKSLPVALSRILSLLKHVSQENRLEQWKLISTLDFSSNAVPKILKARTPCWAFITEEMKITADNSDRCDYQSPESLGLISGSAGFFRFVSHQGRDNQLPLEFYRYMQEQMDEAGFNAGIKNRLYIIIASSTTGYTKVNNLSLEDAKRHLDDIINIVKSVVVPIPVMPLTTKEEWQEEALGNLTDLLHSPPMPQTKKVLLMFRNLMSGLTNFMLGFIPVLDLQRALGRVLYDFGEAVYDGMKDYQDEDLNSRKLLSSYVTLIEAITNYSNKIHINKKTALVKMISTFNVEEKDIDSIFKAVDGTRCSEAFLSILPLVSRKGKTPLNVDDLLCILEQIKQHPEIELIELIKNIELRNSSLKLLDYLPEKITVFYGKKEIPGKVILLIEDHFNEEQQVQIKKMLMHFNHPGDSFHYEALVKRLIQITRPPLSPSEKNLFIARLFSLSECYSEPKTLADRNNPFINLLDAIIHYNAVDDFLHFIHARQQHPEEASEGLVEKALLFINRVQPLRWNVKERHLSPLEIQPSILKTLLKTPALQLNKTINVPGKDADYLPIIAALKSLTKDGSDNLLTDIRQQLNDADIAYSARTERYLKGLNELQAPNAADLQTIKDNPSLRCLFQRLSESNIADQIASNIKDNHPNAHQIRSWVSKLWRIDLKKVSGVLFKNPLLFKSIADKDVIKICKNPDFIANEEQLSFVLSKLEADLKNADEVLYETKRVRDELNEEVKSLGKYPNTFIRLYKTLNTIAAANPNSKAALLALFDTYLDHYSPEKHENLIQYLSDFANILEQNFAEITDKNVVLSLCLQFNREDEERRPAKLLRLFEEVAILGDEARSRVLKIAVSLINSEKEYKLEDMTRLCSIIKQNESILDPLTIIYDKAPFPSIKQFINWYEEGIRHQNILQQYRAFSIQPCEREERNGFKVEKALQQLPQFKINGRQPGDHSPADRQAYLEKFHQLTLDMQQKTPEELFKIYQGFKNGSLKTIDYEQLVAVCAELLYRSKGRAENSMEINTTQYLAILSILKTPGHVTSQISTGEGKTRIMMILIACYHALGMTVDFVTSNVALATRDFVEFQAYFEMLGAKNALIFSSSAPSDYKKSGINFSDPAGLSLFRNKARSQGLGHLVIPDDKPSRALLLDEGDKTFFDVADTRFNVSAEANENICGMQWIYPLLMEYFSQQEVSLTDGQTKMSPMELYFENIDESRESFMRFAGGTLNRSKMKRLETLSQAQIEQWQVSAVTASQLKYKEDYVIESDVLINSPTGPKLSSEAQLLFANRVSINAKFSYGVHQCLHARLNLARENPNSIADENLRKTLQNCSQAFYVPDEKQIVYSSTSKNLLDDYEQGTIKAVTGTAGSLLEREEASRLYEQTEAGSMNFIEVPRDQGLNRRDKSIRLEKNRKDQIKTLRQQIQEARARNQPVLIIAENDEESLSLYKKLSRTFNHNEIQHIHSQLSGPEEKRRIDQASFPGQITVSTDMIGRGTDISLKNAAREHGLSLMLTYLPRVRDLMQIIGRAARFGDPGNSSIVLDKRRLKKRLGRQKLGSAFYRNAEAYIERAQAMMDRQQQSERLIKNTLGDFRKILTLNFFEMLQQHHESHRDLLRPAWSTFVDKSDKAWNEVWPNIQTELLKENIDIEAINSLLAQYQNHTQQAWHALRRTIENMDLFTQDGIASIDKLCKTLPEFTLPDNCKTILTDFDIEHYISNDIKIYDEYDIGHDGRAVSYTHWYTPLLATLKGYANLIPGVHFADARVPFANFRAWINNRGQIFPNTRAFLANIFEAIRNWCRGRPTESATPDASHSAPIAESSYHQFFSRGIAGTKPTDETLLEETDSSDQEIIYPLGIEYETDSENNNQAVDYRSLSIN